jgi:hypothetical protein
LRRTLIALTALASLAVFASGGSGALGISPGVFGAAPDSMSFGQVSGNNPQTKTETLTNNGSSTVNISSATLSGSGDFSLSNNTCNNAAVDPNQTCTVDITFDPTSTGGESASLDIVDDDPSSPQSVDIGGTGVSPEFSLGAGIAFGDIVVGNSSPGQIIVTNNTDYSDSTPNISFGGSNPGQFNFDASGCNGSIPANGTCTLNVSFAPTNAGNASATVSMGGQTVSVTGRGTQAGAGLSTGSLGFGSQPLATKSGSQSITLTDNGTAPLTYGTTTLGGSNPGDFTFDDTACQNVVLNPGDQCTITAAFVPTATGGRSAVLTVHDNAPGNPTQTVNLSGNGTPSSIGFSPASVTFTNPVVAGLASPVHGITIQNTTNSSMPITGITIVGTNPKNFIHSADTCTGQTLAPNAKCSIHVEFAPTAAGHRTASLQVTDNGSISPHTHVLTLTGTGTAPNNAKLVRGAVGCASSQVTWVSPSASRFAGVRVVRNHAHYPANINDGTIVPRTSGVATDSGLKHFTTYYYRVFATYHSKTRPSQINYSAGTKLRLRTGEVCTPRNGARITDLTPKFTWLASATQNGYAFVLQRGETTIEINYTKKTSFQLKSSWHYNRNVHRLLEGNTYTFFLYAYPKAHPNGILIGQSAFSVR